MEITLGWRRYCNKFFSCPLVRTLGDSALVWYFSKFWACINFSLSLVVFILQRCPLMVYGAFVYLWDVLWLLYSQTLYLLLLVLKASRSWRSSMSLSSLISFVFSHVSNDIASFKPIRCLGVFIGDSPPTSRCLFSPDIGI